MTPLPEGSEVQIKVSFGQDERTCSGMVAWCQREPSKSGSAMGVSFTLVDAAAVRELLGLMKGIRRPVVPNEPHPEARAGGVR